MTITTQHTGKRAEFLVFSELIKRNADIYIPIIDVGVDALVRQRDGTHLELQVKSTEKGWSLALYGNPLFGSVAKLIPVYCFYCYLL